MKFHRFPYLVQRKLCSLLIPLDLLLLSFCSNRTRRAVKKAIGNRKCDIWVSDNTYDMSIYYRNNDKFDYICYATRERLPVPRPVIYIEIDGVDVRVSWELRPTVFCSIYVINERHIILMHKYICSLFNAPEEFFVKTDQVKTDFPSMRRSNLQNSKVTIDQLEEFYLFYPEQEFSEVEGSLENGYVRFDENVLVVRNLILRGTIISTLKCFRLFKGEHGYFEDIYISSWEITLAMKEWMKRTDDGLKSIIYKPYEKYDVENVKEKIREIGCGEQRKETIYPYKSLITQYQNFPSNIFDCTNGIDIRRDTDGKLATITLFPDYVTFFVWD